MVEYIVAIDVTRVRFPADALLLWGLWGLTLWTAWRSMAQLTLRVQCYSTFDSQRGYGATVARLTPDQTVGRSNRSGSDRYTMGASVKK